MARRPGIASLLLQHGVSLGKWLVIIGAHTRCVGCFAIFSHGTACGGRRSTYCCSRLSCRDPLGLLELCECPVSHGVQLQSFQESIDWRDIEAWTMWCCLNRREKGSGVNIGLYVASPGSDDSTQLGAEVRGHVLLTSDRRYPCLTCAMDVTETYTSCV